MNRLRVAFIVISLPSRPWGGRQFKMGRVVVLGSSNTDLILRTERLPKGGETVLGSSFQQAGGGKGANQAVAAARAGASVAFIAAVGDDSFGEIARRSLAVEGISLEHVRVISGEASGIALIFVDDAGRNLIGVAPGANARISANDIDALPESLFHSANVFVAQLETPIDAVFSALSRAHAARMFTILNPAPFDPRIASVEWMRIIDLLVVNEHEASLFGQALGFESPAVTDADSARSFLAMFRNHGANDVIVTLGDAGYVLSTPDLLNHFPGLVVDAVDTVAAGDTFVGVLACGISEGRSVIQSSHIANFAASLAVTRRGAQPSIPRRDEINAALQVAENDCS